MLSVTSATVHQTMCPTPPKSNSNPPRLVRKDRLWGKFNPFSKNRCRNNNTKKEVPIYISSETTLNDVPKQLKNVSLSVVASTASNNTEREPPPISFTVKENVWTKNTDEDNTTAVASNIHENEVHWIVEEIDTTLSTAVSNKFEQEENNNLTKDIAVERKRKRGAQSRIANAIKYLKTSDNVSVHSMSDTNQINTISDVSNDDITNDTVLPIENNNIEKWNTKDGEENWDELWQPDNVHPDMPYYMTGFPNPPGENRCWLNATLHTLFILPLIDYFDYIDLNQCPRLIKTLIAIQQYYKKGIADKETTYQIVKKFKEELAVLDEAYPSQKQQDVSEFLMIFLNYIKTEFEQLEVATKSRKQITYKTENVPENGQNIVNNISRNQTTPKKRVPLATISSLKNIKIVNETEERNIEIPSLKNSDHEISETLTVCNPIDKFFLLNMMEHYICKGCSEHRQRNIDNLMLYVDIPDKETEIINLTDAIAKSMEPEERNLTCAKCKHSVHNVSTSFRSSPTVLMVQINRYGMTNEGIVEKINTAVNIPEELTLDYNNDNKTDNFKLCGIIAHVGSAMDCGHYTSYAVHEDEWFHYNDMDVVPMSKDEALTAAQTTAYLVFFINNKLLSKKSTHTFDTEENPLR